MSSLIPATPAFINPRDLNRLGIDLSGSIGPDFRAPLFDILKIPHDCQTIIAEYWSGDGSNEAFSPTVLYRIYNRIYQQCCTDHRIKYLIPWNPEVLKYTSPHQITLLSSSSRDLVIRQKFADLFNKIHVFSWIPALTDTPELEALVKKKALTPYELGARAELYALLWMRMIIPHEVTAARAHNFRAALFRGSPLMYISVHLTTFGEKIPLSPLFRTEMLTQLCARTIIYALDHPNVPINQLPFPQEIPQDLPGMPGQQQNPPPQPAVALPAGQPAQPVNNPQLPIAQQPPPQNAISSSMLFIVGLIGGVASRVFFSISQNPMIWIRSLSELWIGFSLGISILSMCITEVVLLGSLFDAPTFRSALKVVAVAFGGAACGFMASPYALNRLLR